MDGHRRFLIVEDSPQDAELEERNLRKAGLEFTSRRVETRDRLVEAVKEFKPHLVICDFNMPTLDGMSALRLVRVADGEVPFIFVSGTIGEERAIESLKGGATDYVLKSQLGSLVPKVRRALQDVEDRQHQKKLELELGQSKKLEAIGRLAGGVAHDFSNLLSAIMGHAELLLARARPEDGTAEALKEVMSIGQRGAALTRQLLAISRRQVLAPVVLDLNKHVADISGVLGRTLGGDIELVTRLEPDLGSIQADPSQIEQVIINLAANARDAMVQVGKLVIETSNVMIDESYARAHPGATPGPHVRLSVTDTGPGMSAETRDHLFEPFLTTKEPGKGTGLGLSTTYGIVRQSGGSIEVRSEPGRGATFRLNFPRVRKRAEPPWKEPVHRASAGASPTLLVAEDFDPLRRLIHYALEKAGFSVLSAPDGVEALRLAEGHTGTIHLLMTDVMMPRMGGVELANRLIRSRPEMRVLYTSGSDNSGPVASPSHRPIEFLGKPFTPEEMVRKVREVLGVAVAR